MRGPLRYRVTRDGAVVDTAMPRAISAAQKGSPASYGNSNERRTTLGALSNSALEKP